MRTAAVRCPGCLLLLQLLGLPCWTDGICARFEFPDLNINDSFTARTSEQITISFLLNTKNCHHVKNISITVSKVSQQGGDIFIDICKWLVYSNGACLSFSLNCVCGERQGFYILRKTVDHSDQTLWRWKTSNNAVSLETFITFKMIENDSRKEQLFTIIVSVVVVLIVLIISIIVLVLKKRLRPSYAVCSPRLREVHYSHSSDATASIHQYEEFNKALGQQALCESADIDHSYLHPISPTHQALQVETNPPPLPPANRLAPETGTRKY